MGPQGHSLSLSYSGGGRNPAGVNTNLVKS
jgi:hypothetical protein